MIRLKLIGRILNKMEVALYKTTENDERIVLYVVER